MAIGIYPYFIPFEDSEGTEVTIQGHRLIMMGSNNYLGLTTHPLVREAAIAAIKRYGTSCTGSRFLNGTLELHKQLEAELADFVSMESALVFSTGYQVNIGTISALLGPHDYVIIDKDDHASIVDGCKMSLGQMKRFAHSSPASLEKTLSNLPAHSGKLVVVDGIFSMGGDITPLPGLVDVCQRYDATMMVDDAHALGVLGGARGTAAHFGLTRGVDLIMGTFSKSFASIGGFIAGAETVVHYIQHFARSMIFSASISPPNAAAALASLRIMRSEPERVERLWANAARYRKGLQVLGYDTLTSETPIVPVNMGEETVAAMTWKMLFDMGVYVNVALPPAVPPNQALLRTSVMATHTDAQIDRVLEIFAEVRHMVPVVVPA